MSGDGVRFTVEGTAAADPATVSRRLLESDITTTFTGHGPFPAVTSRADGPGGWEGPGSTRQVSFSDGGSAHESLEEFAEGSRYTYRVVRFTNAVRHLATELVMEWRFRPAGHSGTAIEWTVTFKPLPYRSWIVRSIVGPLWRRYMRAILTRVIDLAGPTAQTPHR